MPPPKTACCPSIIIWWSTRRIIWKTPPPSSSSFKADVRTVKQLLSTLHPPDGGRAGGLLADLSAILKRVPDDVAALVRDQLLRSQVEVEAVGARLSNFWEVIDEIVSSAHPQAGNGDYDAALAHHRRRSATSRCGSRSRCPGRTCPSPGRRCASGCLPCSAPRETWRKVAMHPRDWKALARSSAPCCAT